MRTPAPIPAAHPAHRWRFDRWQCHLLVVCLFGSHPLAAQVGSLKGRVVFDTAASFGLSQVEISIPALNLRLRPDSAGRYSLPTLAPGRYLVTARALGFTPVADSVTIEAFTESVRDFQLVRNATSLPEVVTRGKSAYISPALRAFEERRARGIGRFLGEADLRKNDNSKLSNVLSARIPGLQIIRTYKQSAFAAATRTPIDVREALRPRSGPPRPCWLTLYVDGVLMYDPTLTINDPPPPPNIDQFSVSELAGVEFYHTATTPAGIRASACGTLLFWTRER